MRAGERFRAGPRAVENPHIFLMQADKKIVRRTGVFWLVRQT